MPERVRNRINIIVGDVLNADQVANALEGQDVVISCLGTGWSLGGYDRIILGHLYRTRGSMPQLLLIDATL